MSLPILSILLIICLLAPFTFAFNKSADRKSLQKQALFLAFLISALCLAVSFLFFQNAESGLQLVEAYKWIEVESADGIWKILAFKLGIDGLSVNMLILMGLILPIIVASQKIQVSRLNYGLLFTLISSVIGVFIAQDLISFFIFFELEIIPLYILLSQDNSIGNSISKSGKNETANQFLIYSLTAGAFILAGILVLFMANNGKTFSFTEFNAFNFNSLSEDYQNLIKLSFFLFLIGLLIKIPSLPFHSWFIKAVQKSSLGLSALLMIKVGAYVLIRFVSELFPLLWKEYAWFIALIGIINIIVAGLFALRQKEIKLIIAYSVISHLGFVLLGLASANSAGISGALFQIFSHTILSIALILAVNIIEKKVGKHNLELSDLGGLAKVMPVFFFVFMGLVMANLGLPLLSGFIGESLVFYGLFTNSPDFTYTQISALIAVLSVVFSAAYMLYLLKESFFGELIIKLEESSDIAGRDKVLLSSLLVISLFLGIYPQLLTDKSKTSLELIENNLQLASKN